MKRTYQTTKAFDKDYEKAPVKIQRIADQRIILLVSDPFNSLLNNHALKGDKEGYRSVNVTGDWRIIYKVSTDGKIEFFTLLRLGTHNQIYNR